MIKLNCHLHPKNDCFIVIKGNNYYHTIVTKSILQHTYLTFNCSISNGEFSEMLCPLNIPMFLSPIAYTNIRNYEESFEHLEVMFQCLDDSNLSYSKNSCAIQSLVSSTSTTAEKKSKYLREAEVMVKQHIITNSIDKIEFCNKHLLVKRTNNCKFKYNSNVWKLNILYALFPKSKSKTVVSTDTPLWVLDRINKYNIKKKPKFKKK